MKKGTKIGLGVGLLLLGVTAVSSCTQSFCSTTDTARIMYAYDPGITHYEQNGADTIEVNVDGGKSYKVTNVKIEVAPWNDTEGYFDFGPGDYSTSNLDNIIVASRNSGYVTPDKNSREYFAALDEVVMYSILTEATLKSGETNIVRDLSKEEDYRLFKNDVSKYSYMKFTTANGAPMWDIYDKYDAEVRQIVQADYCPSSDFVSLYKSRLNSYASAFRTCLTTKEDKYGSYGYDSSGVFIDAKDWGYAWGKGFFEGLLVYPIGWLIDQIVSGFRGAGVSSGGAALLGIVFVTIIIRSVMLLATIKQTTSNAKMTELQPEIQKIQNKYPNSNTSQAEKQRMAEEMQRLYKKNKINPFSSILVMIVQFPIFICVWGALSGSSAITNGSVLGLSLSLGIKDVLFNTVNWGPAGGYAAVTALMLFILMGAAQTISMLLPQWIQKIKAKKVAKLGKNPAQKQQNTTMKIFTYVMLAMILIMGFSLVSAMGIYWFVGAVFSIIQTVITQLITSRKKAK